MKLSLVNCQYIPTGISDPIGDSDYNLILSDTLKKINPMLEDALERGSLSEEDERALNDIINRCDKAKNRALSPSYSCAIDNLKKRIQQILKTPNNRQSLTQLFKNYELMDYELPQMFGPKKTITLKKYKNLDQYLQNEENLGNELFDYGRPLTIASYRDNPVVQKELKCRQTEIIELKRRQIEIIETILSQYHSRSWQAFFWNRICCGLFGEHCSQTLRDLNNLIDMIKNDETQLLIEKDQVQMIIGSEPKRGADRLSLFNNPSQDKIQSGTDEVIYNLADKVFKSM